MGFAAVEFDRCAIISSLFCHYPSAKDNSYTIAESLS